MVANKLIYVKHPKFNLPLDIPLIFTVCKTNSLFMFLLLVLTLTANFSTAQNKPIDVAACSNWPNIIAPAISNNGRYIAYVVDSAKKNEIVIQAANKSWNKKVSVNASSTQKLSFSDDSRWLIFNKASDTIGIIDINTKTETYISQIRLGKFRLLSIKDDQWLVYQKSNSINELVLFNLNNRQNKVFANVDDFFFSEDGVTLVTKNSLVQNGTKRYDVSISNISTSKSSIIANNCNPSNFVLDKKGRSLAFIDEMSVNSQSARTIRYFNSTLDSAEILISPSTAGMNEMELSKASIVFNTSGDKIFFNIQNRNFSTRPQMPDTFAKVDILNYKNNLKHISKVKIGSFLASYDLNSPSRQVVRLGQDSDIVLDNNGKYLLVTNISWTYPEYDSKTTAHAKVQLVSTTDGSRTLIMCGLFGYYPSFSLNGKYAIWFDSKKKAWFTYNLKNKAVTNISKRLNLPTYQESDIPSFARPYNIIGWTKNDASVLIQDRFDIWSVDPTGIGWPVNITLGIGVRNNIQLRYLNFNDSSKDPINLNDTLIFSAFNIHTKQNGFLKICLHNKFKYEKLKIESKLYYLPDDLYIPAISGLANRMLPLKASLANTYLLTFMTSTDYPNLVLTHDFIDFTPMTEFAPQKNYNWYTSELINWKLPNGKSADGILYKPENFDKRKKYPLIFYYYERASAFLNAFIFPELSNGSLNIPWFVSRGYLVVVPDIYNKSGYPGKSAFNSVVSAANYLTKFKWVDPKRLGLQGHSHGGFETNYIVSHSSIFAAASTAEGVSNLINTYNRDNNSWKYYESGQGRMGISVWKRPDLYIENSSIFSADKVTAPLLILHNKQDPIVLYSQGSEWFNALNSLEKKVWMLSYDGEQHSLKQEKNKVDYTTRLQQFFDCYLKNAPPAKWMTTVIPTESKGRLSGLELDTTGTQP
ncbi:prolyl oligopeptidase family serine peptidase [Mucilaginibacter sp. dw_454]|uniref:alpha/beta hydrolase family protein n=1 Tax=Mucilaginibacter sp. dw_454 TaxID=2720079 RepID=UPI001BD45FA6|nr:prolyl oligopeptidase family serine peptidase [Mucilaginibacter sp. dw_454]